METSRAQVIMARRIYRADSNRRDDRGRHKMRRHLCNLPIMTERIVTLKMILIEPRMSVPSDSTPERHEFLAQLHMSYYATRVRKYLIGV